jgi:hypothetical protein
MSADAQPQTYSAAAIPEPFQILGLRLRPFCLGHYWLMERFNLAFVAAEKKEVTLSDLTMAVLICSMTYEDFLEFIDEADWMTKIKAWGESCGGFDIYEKIALFEKYISNALQQPDVVFEGETKESGAHWSQALFSALTGNCGYTAVEARNMPLGQAFMDFFKVAEQSGVIRILSREESDLMRAAERGETVETPGFEMPQEFTGPSELENFKARFLKAKEKCQT